MLYILLKHTHYTQRHTLNGNIEKREREAVWFKGVQHRYELSPLPLFILL